VRKSGAGSFSTAIDFVPPLTKSVPFQSNVPAATVICRRGQIAAAVTDDATMAAPPSTRVRLFICLPLPQDAGFKEDAQETPIKSWQ
jgi:hypothetical protein